MMVQLEVKVPSKTYPVYIGETEVLTQLSHLLTDASQVVVITDQTVYDLHWTTLQAYLPEHVQILVVPPGEKSKDLNHYNQLTQALLVRKVDREAVLIAFGGGMIGDLAGFVAATYLRGVRFIQIPTTLLAHDSCVGGKVAINQAGIKNTLGAFYQPEAVLYNVAFLQTLPEIQWLSGLAELIKHAYLHPELLSAMNHYRTLAEVQQQIAMLLEMAIAVKIHYVQADERENNVRRYLNLGHTFGHAIEAMSNYQTPHGVAVMYGLCFVHELAPFAVSPYVYLTRFGFPPLRFEKQDFEQLYGYMQSDKKAVEATVRFVVSKGEADFTLMSYQHSQLAQAYQRFLCHFNQSEEFPC
ncbi:MAG: 3-dehydroquinate synthase [Culicoidibacterales bacterium]